MAGERVARTNKQRMLVVTTLNPPNGEREGCKEEQTKNARRHNSSPTYDRREGRKDEQTKNARCDNSSATYSGRSSDKDKWPMNTQT